jgi:hypothetical protein
LLQGEVKRRPKPTKLWVRYRRARHRRAIIKPAALLQTRTMSGEPTIRKDTLKVEKVSLLILTLCVLVLVSLLVFKPF